MTSDLSNVSGLFMRTAERLPSLFDLSAEELRLLSDLEDAYRAEEPDQEAVDRLAAQFVGNEALVVRKVENYIGLLAHLDMLSAARKAQADRLAAKAKTTEAGAKWLKERLLQAMKVMGRDRIETPIGTVRVQSNPGRVEVLAEQMVPREFIKTVITTSVDKRAISAHIKASGEVPEGIEFVKSDSLRVS